MHRNWPTLFSNWLLPRQVAGVCLAALYLLTATPAAPVLTALLAMADGGHRVAVQQTAHSTHVVLHHDCSNSVWHHHGIVARALILAAQQSTATHPDHVIQLPAATPSEQACGPGIEAALDAPLPVLFLPWDQRPGPAEPTLGRATHSRPPPDSFCCFLSTRTTVLLI